MIKKIGVLDKGSRSSFKKSDLKIKTSLEDKSLVFSHLDEIKKYYELKVSQRLFFFDGTDCNFR